MGHLTEYIKKKALYDPADPRKVYCENDQLGEIFGCREFSTSNAW
jgi:chromatin remodeling complex protein RSC6